MKPNCYECKHRGSVPGDAHSQCRHPDAGGDGKLNGIIAALGITANKQLGAAKKLHIEGAPHGIRMGWFLWPLNFDPCWLENCDGFTPKEVSADNETPGAQAQSDESRNKPCNQSGCKPHSIGQNVQPSKGIGGRSKRNNSSNQSGSKSSDKT